MTARARRLFLLRFGAEPSPKSISVRGGPERLIWCPVVGALVDTDIGWVLLDTGIGGELLRDEAARRAIYASTEQPRGTPLARVLGELGVSVGDLALAAVSHLHCDHSGGLPALAEAGIDVAVHRDELAFAHGEAGLEHAYYRPDFADPALRWRVLDGDAELAPGVWALATPGHTPGHLSYRVDLPASGTWLLAMDAADLGENLNDRVPPGWTARPQDADRASTSLQRLLDEAERLGARLVPGHDEAFWTAVRHPAGGHR